MKNVTRHIGQFHVVEKLRNSKNGNPRFALLIAGYHCVTKPDSDIAYNIHRYDGKAVEATLGTYRGKCTLVTVKMLEA
jgi:hypothetical protein